MTLSAADAVIAFGSDATMASLRAQTALEPKIHRAWPRRQPALACRAGTTDAARGPRLRDVDVLTYDQLGCLSPQAIYVPEGADIDALGGKMARALEAHWRVAGEKARATAVASRRASSRRATSPSRSAIASGCRRRSHLGWTLIHDPDPTFALSPLHGVIPIREARESQTCRARWPRFAGRISTVGLVGRLSSHAERVFLNLGGFRVFARRAACNFHL